MKKNNYIIYAVLSIILIVILIIPIVKTDKLKIPLQNISSFKISSMSISKLKEISKKYNIDFIELLTYYSVDNNFFDTKNISDISIEENFFVNYDKIKAKYTKTQIKPYYKLIKTIIDEIKMFPISKDNAGKYIYSDSFGTTREYGGKRKHLGTDIMDRENIDNRIAIISMTDGKIENIGWNEKGGYRVGIRTKSGNYYYYAHFSKFKENIKKGDIVKAGDILGYMGSTGYSKKEGTKGKFPTHLHLGMEIKNSLSSKEIWINPYPFLIIRELEIENNKNDKNNNK